MDNNKVDLLSKYAHLLPGQDHKTWRHKLAYVAPQPRGEEREEAPSHSAPVTTQVKINTVDSLRNELTSSVMKEAPSKAVENEETVTQPVVESWGKEEIRQGTSEMMKESTPPVTPVVKLSLAQITADTQSKLSGAQEILQAHRTSVAALQSVTTKQNKAEAEVVVEPLVIIESTVVSSSVEKAEHKIENKVAEEMVVNKVEDGCTVAENPIFQNVKSQVQILSSISTSYLEKGGVIEDASSAMIRMKFSSQTLQREVSHLEQVYHACDTDRLFLQDEVAKSQITETKLREQIASLEAKLIAHGISSSA